MKSYGHLKEELLRDDTISSAIDSAAEGKNKNKARHQKLRHIKRNKEKYVPIVRKWLLNYEQSQYKRTSKVINDGISAKKREILVPTYQEEIILNAVMIVLRRILTPSMYEHSYASIPGRGTHKATKHIAKWIKKDCINTQYAFQLDITQFFKSINQEILRKKLKNKIRDEWFLELNYKIISVQPRGVPLGFPTSQWYSNFYLTELDHYIKEQLHAKYYVRFSDDLLIFGSSKVELQECRDKIFSIIETDLDLCVKPNWQIYAVDKPAPDREGRVVDYLGYKHHRDYTLMRKKILLRFDRKIRHVKRKGVTNIKDARQLVTYAGYLKHANCYKWYERHVAGKINLRYMRKKISNHSKRSNKKEKSLCGTQQNLIFSPP